MATAPEASLRLLGLAARAGAVVVGTERVREAARAGELRFALVAADTSSHRRDRLVPLLKGSGIPYRVAFDRDRLGGAVGKGPLGAVGITVQSFADRLQALLHDMGSAAGAE